MRITNLQQSKTFINDIFEKQKELMIAQGQVSSGLRVSNASDDPGRAGTIVDLQSALDRIDKHEQRIAYATSFLAQQENIVSEAQNIMIRAKEVATQGANETLSREDRRLLSEEVFQLRDTLVALANTKFQGVYLYGGADDDDPPFDVSTTSYTVPTYAVSPGANTRWLHDGEDGTDVTREVNVSDTISVRLNSAGDDVFEDSIFALDRLGRALWGVETLPAANPPDPTLGVEYTTDTAGYQAQTADIQSTINLIETARVDDLGPERTNIGGRISRVEMVSQILQTLQLDTEKARSALQDVDITEAATKLTKAQQAIEATLTSGSMILNQLTLLDFL